MIDKASFDAQVRHHVHHAESYEEDEEEFEPHEPSPIPIIPGARNDQGPMIEEVPEVIHEAVSIICLKYLLSNRKASSRANAHARSPFERTP